MKIIRKAILRRRLETQLEKYSRRIQKMAENAYKIRQALELMDREGVQDAVHQDSGQGSVSSAPPNDGAGGSDVSDSAIIEAVLGEQPAELPDNIGDLGIDSGSAV